MKYFTINIENTEMKLKIPDSLVTHVLGRVSPFGGKLPASYCLKCNKKIDVEKVQDAIGNGKVLRCQSEKAPLF